MVCRALSHGQIESRGMHCLLPRGDALADVSMPSLSSTISKPLCRRSREPVILANGLSVRKMKVKHTVPVKLGWLLFFFRERTFFSLCHLALVFYDIAHMPRRHWLSQGPHGLEML
jgi:hypothetical protein